MKIRVIIPTYNRESELYSLCQQIEKESLSYSHNHGLDLSVQIWVDGCEYSKFYFGSETADVRIASHHGKKEHWKLCDYILKNQYGTNFDLYIWLPDDAVLVEGFFRQVVNQWESIRDPEKVCLNLLMDIARRGKPNWTGFKPRTERHGKIRVWFSQWVDMCFAFDKRFLDAMDYTIKPVNPNRWKNNERLSSGVGKQISQRLFKIPLKMFQVDKSLIRTGHLPSVMHPWRKPKEWKE